MWHVPVSILSMLFHINRNDAGWTSVLENKRGKNLGFKNNYVSIACNIKENSQDCTCTFKRLYQVFMSD